MYSNVAPLARLFVALFGLGMIVQVVMRFGNADAFWAIILIIWIVESVKSSKKNVSDLFVRSLLAVAGIAAVGVGVNVTHHIAVLWALILINWFVDSVADMIVEE